MTAAAGLKMRCLPAEICAPLEGVCGSRGGDSGFPRRPHPAFSRATSQFRTQTVLRSVGAIGPVPVFDALGSGYPSDGPTPVGRQPSPHTVGYHSVKLFDTPGRRILHAAIADSIRGRLEDCRRRQVWRPGRRWQPVRTRSHRVTLRSTGDLTPPPAAIAGTRRDESVSARYCRTLAGMCRLP